MAKRKPAQVDDELGFIPEEDMTSQKKMEPSMTSDEKELGFVADTSMPEPEPDGVIRTLKDVAITAPQGLTTWADEIQAAGQALGKKAFGEEMPLSDIYEQDVQQIRQNISQARERSPWATTAGEIGTSVGSALLPGALAAKGIGGLSKLAASTAAAGKFGGIGGMALRGAAEGLGAADTDYLFPTIAGGALGAIGGAATKGLKAITTQSPERIRAGVLGARTAEFKEIGFKEREALAKELADMGLFQKTKAKFDPAKGKWVSEGSALENIEAPTRDKLLTRIDDAFEATQEEKKKLFKRELAKPVINKEGLESNLQDVAKKWADKRTGIEPRLDVANAEVSSILKDLEYKVNKSPDKVLTIEMLEEAKQRLDRDVSNFGKDPLLGRINDMADLYNGLYSTINNSLQFEIFDPAYKNLNRMQSKLYTVKADLKKAIASEPAKFSPMNIASWLQSPDTQVDVARAAELMNAPLAKPFKTPLRISGAEAPFGIIRNYDPSMSNPYSSGRTPQSVDFSPREIINFRIPRSTQGILENKDKVLAKMVQKGLSDEMLETLTVALNGEPDDLSNVMPLIMTQMPEIFEKSKYKVFDGKFMDPNDRAKAADDISKRDDIDSIKRAKMISKINKTGEVPEGLV
jgi:hypothetical protein